MRLFLRPTDSCRAQVPDFPYGTPKRSPVGRTPNHSAISARRQAAHQITVHSVRKGKSVAMVAWSIEEDEALCIATTNISEDGKIATDQVNGMVFMIYNVP